MVITSKDVPVITVQKPIPKKLLCPWPYVLLVLIRGYLKRLSVKIIAKGNAIIKPKSPLELRKNQGFQTHAGGFFLFRCGF
jgi:hypothetical protein